jgi:hypothetical protein
MNLAEKIREIESLEDRAGQPGYQWDDAGEMRLCELEDEVAGQLVAAGVLMEMEDGDWGVHPDWRDSMGKLSLTEGWVVHPDWRDSMGKLTIPEDTRTVGDYVMRWDDDIRRMESIKVHGIPLAITEYQEKAKLQGFKADRPNDELSTVEERGGRRFVVLRNADDEELARYVVVDVDQSEGSDYCDVLTWWRLQYVESEQDKAA